MRVGWNVLVVTSLHFSIREATLSRSQLSSLIETRLFKIHDQVLVRRIYHGRCKAVDEIRKGERGVDHGRKCRQVDYQI